ncbi:UbiH/UbiF family hydroxylase [Aromatoleum aromaticum]|uniref:Flavoprotein monooxygenase (Probable aromatic-ring hydroxylase) n=1 Tax=Aromatoleum aromaticum (strain DSM 19018 / LMG 30748 / EbN1) TaxID=76114 RepID=Q5P2M0_AROAE|nr:UbiH/UbiF family hydroxylase [Aromatoleum aromaticum]NMG56363.1 UbiH/UbiF family hydroxylase [Aromatoleum aromaticum]CAI08444.1 Flavoprotein monooxygenase (probable aromatic-ring hydroxylase) [Aromatoleum aromaticum EbN1]
MDFDLIIIGGGLAGASLAVALRASRLRIAVVETHLPADVPGWDSRIYAVSPENADFLREIGAWRHLDASRINPVHAMSIRGDAGGSLEFSAYESGLPELAWIVESGRLHRELWETMRRQHNVTLLCGISPVRFSQGAASVTVGLSDGRQANARLVVGADGVNSWVRQQAGIAATFTPYDEVGVVANFRCERGHRNVAYQWFRPDGILALLPLPGKMVSMVWSAPAGCAQELLALDADSLCRRVADATSGELGYLKLETPAAGFPLRLMRVDTTVKSRIAVIGDAAHAIHPLSGHGINLGFKDARELASVLNGLAPWRDPGEIAVLRGYARQRAEEPFLLQNTTHVLNRLFGTANPVLTVLRNVGLNLTDRLPVVRHALVRYAAGGRF